jgi:amidase
MKVTEYARYDGLGLAELVSSKEVSPRELAETALKAIEAANPGVKAVVEIYPDRIDGLDEAALGSGPFRGVPFLMKDVFGHEKGRRIEFGSRLCQGMVAEADTHLAELFRASGVNILGRSAAPEYSMSATTESALHGNTSNPWKQGYSAGGSTGGGMAAVMSGMVPIAHGSDIGGSIRIPASWCGGVGLKPSRGRISSGPLVDEGGFGMTSNLIQAKTVRDAAAMLDCLAVPQVGDPFPIPKPDRPYAELARGTPPRLRVGIVLAELVGVPVDPEVAAAVRAAGNALADMGHAVEEATADMGGLATLNQWNQVVFFAFDARLDGFARRTGRTPGPDTLEPVTLSLYERAKEITPARFMAATAALNSARRQLARFYAKYDIWLSPTTARVAEPWGKYNLGRQSSDAGAGSLFQEPIQYTVPHNIMGTPAMSLPLAMHSVGVPIGVQVAGRPAAEHLVLQLATALEGAMPWRDRVPPLHVSRL